MHVAFGPVLLFVKANYGVREGIFRLVRQSCWGTNLSNFVEFMKFLRLELVVDMFVPRE